MLSSCAIGRVFTQTSHILFSLLQGERTTSNCRVTDTHQQLYQRNCLVEEPTRKYRCRKIDRETERKNSRTGGTGFAAPGLGQDSVR